MLDLLSFVQLGKLSQARWRFKTGVHLSDEMDDLR